MVLSPGYLNLFSVLGRAVVQWRLWYTSALQIEESPSGAVHSHVHLVVADVVKSSDTVDRGILERVSS